MTLEVEVFAALNTVVPNRAYALAFPLVPAIPITPAIKYQFISSEINGDMCGDGGDTIANTRTQVDVFSTTHASVRTLRLQTIAAMTAMSTPTTWGGGFDDYDADLKLFRCSMDFISYPSS